MQSTHGIENKISEHELHAVVRSERPEWSFQSMIGRSQIMQRLFAQMRYTAAHLRIAERRCAALIVIGGRAFDAVHRIADDRIALTKVVEQRKRPDLPS